MLQYTVFENEKNIDITEDNFFFRFFSSSIFISFLLDLFFIGNINLIPLFSELNAGI